MDRCGRAGIPARESGGRTAAFPSPARRAGARLPHYSAADCRTQRSFSCTKVPADPEAGKSPTDTRLRPGDHLVP